MHKRRYEFLIMHRSISYHGLPATEGYTTLRGQKDKSPKAAHTCIRSPSIPTFSFSAKERDPEKSLRIMMR